MFAGLVTVAEPRCARAVFTKHDSVGKLRVMSTLPVDKGLQLGGRSDPIYQKIKNLVFEQFDTQSWQDLDDPEEWITWLYRGETCS